MRFLSLTAAPLAVVIALCANVRGDAPGDIVLSFDSPGTGPTGLTYGDGSLWCADEDGDVIYSLDPSDGSILDSFSSPGSCPRGLAWDADDYLWCADSCSDTIYRMDPSDGSVVSSFPSPGSTPRGLVFFDGYLRVSDSNSQLIYKLDPSNGSTISTFPVANSYPRGLAWDGSRLWNIDGEAETVYRMDPDTGAIDLLVPTLCGFGHGLTWDGSCLWYADNTGAAIYRVLVDGSDLYSQSKPRHFAIRFTQVTSGIGYCTTNFAVPADSLHQLLTRSCVYDPGGFAPVTDQWGQEARQYGRTVAGDSSANWNVGAVTYNLRYFLDPDACGTVADIPAGIMADYTVDGAKYDITDPVITGAAAAAVGAETNLYWMYRNIHDYVIDHISYEAAGGWDAAPTVLSRGTGSCSEYSYVFVAICRAAGLPARYQGGSRLRQDNLPYTDSVFHRWQEMYIPHYGGWVPVDCTHDDKSLPGARLQKFGYIPNTFFPTTTGGGGSTCLDWNYNSYDNWSIGYGSKTRSFYWFSNSLAAASSASASGESGDVTIAYSLADPEGDWTDIRAEYSINGGSTWEAATAGTGGDGTEQLESDPGGSAHTFVWDSLADIGYTPYTDLVFSITPCIEYDGTPAETDPFPVDNRVDTDGDGLYDHEEAVHGTYTDDHDSDDDGYTDLQEVVSGSNPLNGGETPALLRVNFQPSPAANPDGYVPASEAAYAEARGCGWL